MKRLTMKFLSIQVDMPDDAEPSKFAQESIELINLTLQREPHGLAAQVFDNGNPVIDVEPLDDEDTD